MQNTLETLPEAIVPREHGTLYCRALQDLVFIKPLQSRTEDIADLLNTEKQVQRQNEKTEEFVPNERIGQGGHLGGSVS